MPLRVRDRGHELELSDLTLHRMVQLVEKTRKAERGFQLCKVDSAVHPGRDNTGGVLSVTPRDCRGVGGSFIGSFHTHPEYKVIGISDPSWGDAYSIAKTSLVRTSIGCRGGASDRRVRCEVMKQTPSPEYVSKLRRKYRHLAHTLLSEDTDFEAKLETVVNLPIGQIEEIIKPPPPVPPPPAPPVEVAKTALYREGAIAGFDISHPKPTRATLVDMIHRQHPELSMSELDNARIIYYDGYAEVRLK